jgi:ribosomal protein L7/L12
MPLESLRCPDCTAPVREGERVCAYCGATLVANGARTETRWFVLLRVGPSNVERVARTLHDHLRIDEAEALALIGRPRCEIPVGDDEGHARAIVLAVEDAGAQAEIISRQFEIPLVSVVLDQVGTDKLAVIVAIRSHLDVSIAEAKEIIASPPRTLLTSAHPEKARALATALEAAGASARVT